MSRPRPSPKAARPRVPYDGAGNLTGTVDALNQTVTRSYDSNNRLTFVDYPGTADDLTTIRLGIPRSSRSWHRRCRAVRPTC